MGSRSTESGLSRLEESTGGNGVLLHMGTSPWCFHCSCSSDPWLYKSIAYPDAAGRWGCSSSSQVATSSWWVEWGKGDEALECVEDLTSKISKKSEKATTYVFSASIFWTALRRHWRSTSGLNDQFGLTISAKKSTSSCSCGTTANDHCSGTQRLWTGRCNSFPHQSQSLRWVCTGRATEGISGGSSRHAFSCHGHVFQVHAAANVVERGSVLPPLQREGIASFGRQLSSYIDRECDP